MTSTKESSGKIWLLLALLVLVVAASAFSIANSSKEATGGLTKKDVEVIVSEYIQNNPQQIIDSLTEYQKEQAESQARNAAQKALDNRERLEDTANVAFIGAEDADVVIVEFFDFYCPYCKRAYPELVKVAEQDSKVKVIFREYPIFGAHSDLAANISVAIHKAQPEKYQDFHAAMMKSNARNKQGILDVAKRVGVDVAKVEPLINSDEVLAVVQENRALGDLIGVSGVPAIFVNATPLNAAPVASDMLRVVNQMRN